MVASRGSRDDIMSDDYAMKSEEIVDADLEKIANDFKLF
jgi:hypothetical protein